MTEDQDSTSSSPLDRAATGGPLPTTDGVSDSDPTREDVVSQDEGVVPLADEDLDPRGDTEQREQEIADDTTVGGVNMSSGLTN